MMRVTRFELVEPCLTLSGCPCTGPDCARRQLIHGKRANARTEELLPPRPGGGGWLTEGGGWVTEGAGGAQAAIQGVVYAVADPAATQPCTVMS